MNSGIYLLLKENAFFKGFSQAALETLSDSAQLCTADKGALVYSKKDPSNYMYVVVRGAIKLGARLSNGNTYLKDLALDGDIFGENIFITESGRKEFAEAAHRTNYIRIDGEVMKQLVAESPVLANTMIKFIVSRTQKLDARLHRYQFFNAKERITEFLQSLGSRYTLHNKVKDGYFTHSLSHLDIAEITDTSRQTVARVMSELKEEGLIAFASRRPTTLNVERLMAV